MRFVIRICLGLVFLILVGFSLVILFMYEGVGFGKVWGMISSFKVDDCSRVVIFVFIYVIFIIEM